MSSEALLAIGSFLTAVVTALIAFLNHRNTARKDFVEELRKEVARSQERLGKLEVERNQLADERLRQNDRIEALEDENGRLKRQSEAQDAVIVEHASRASRLERQVQEMVAEQARSEAARTSLYAHLDTLGRELNLRTLENGDLKAQNLQKQAALDAKDEEIRRLHQRLFELEQRVGGQAG